MTAPAIANAIFDVSQLGAAPRLLNNLTNLLEDLGGALGTVEAVAHGDAIGLLVDPGSELLPRLRDLADRGVRFAACANTLQREGIPPERVLDFAIVVPSAVGELVRRQTEGWAYIKV